MQTAIASEAKPKRRYRVGPGRPAHVSVQLMLPVPPQSPEACGAWVAATGYPIRMARLGCVPGYVQVIIRTAMSGNTKELKALAGPILAALVKYGVIEGEDNVTAILTEWAEGVPAGVAAVTVRQISSPASRHRIQIAQRRACDARIGA